ncbi:MAG: CinA family protein [Lentisphaeria bacterium]
MAEIKKFVPLLESISSILCKKNWMMGTAESCTGGGIGGICTAIPGSSEWFAGGFITYTNEWKQRQLDVKKETLDVYGAVSEQTVCEMLAGLQKNGGVSAGVAVSGIAGPGGAVPGKPVGTVCIGAVAGDKRDVVRCLFAGNRAEVRQQTSYKALQMLDALLKES